MRPRPYLCPACRGNWARFEVIYHLVQQVTKDPRTGEIRYGSDQLELDGRGGRPAVDVRCLVCRFQGNEALFIRAAQRSAPPGQPQPS